MKGFQKLVKKVKKGNKALTCFLFLFLLGTVIVIFDVEVRQDVLKNKVAPIPVFSFPSSYPTLKEKKETNISAKAAIIMDDNSKVMIFGKRPNLRFSMASTVKIMTALVSLSYYKMDDVLTVQSETKNIEGAKIGFKKGQKIGFKNLLYALLLPSANDAALALAQNFPGGEKAFVQKMNKTALDFRLYNTHFGDAAGLLDEQNYTTALDLARLASISLKNKEFSDIVATKHKVISDISNEAWYFLYNLNKLLGTSGVNGVKTGYTSEAGQVLVASKEKEGRKIITVVMGSSNRFEDTKKLLELVDSNVAYLSTHP